MSAFSSEPLNADESNELDYQHPDIRRIVGTTGPMRTPGCKCSVFAKIKGQKKPPFQMAYCYENILVITS
jgi:hypothetical protein